MESEEMNVLVIDDNEVDIEVANTALSQINLGKKIVIYPNFKNRDELRAMRNFINDCIKYCNKKELRTKDYVGTQTTSQWQLEGAVRNSPTKKIKDFISVQNPDWIILDVCFDESRETTEGIDIYNDFFRHPDIRGKQPKVLFWTKYSLKKNSEYYNAIKKTGIDPVSNSLKKAKFEDDRKNQLASKLLDLMGK